MTWPPSFDERIQKAMVFAASNSWTQPIQTESARPSRCSSNQCSSSNQDLRRKRFSHACSRPRRWPKPLTADFNGLRMTLRAASGRPRAQGEHRPPTTRLPRRTTPPTGSPCADVASRIHPGGQPVPCPPAGGAWHPRNGSPASGRGAQQAEGRPTWTPSWPARGGLAAPGSVGPAPRPRRSFRRRGISPNRRWATTRAPRSVARRVGHHIPQRACGPSRLRRRRSPRRHLATDLPPSRTPPDRSRSPERRPTHAAWLLSTRPHNSPSRAKAAVHRSGVSNPRAPRSGPVRPRTPPAGGRPTPARGEAFLLEPGKPAERSRPSCARAPERR